MKKQLIAMVSALAMTFASLPCVSIAAENVPKPVLQYTFDGNKQLADQHGKNELKLSGGASVTDDGNKGKGLLLDGTDAVSYTHLLEAVCPHRSNTHIKNACFRPLFDV